MAVFPSILMPLTVLFVFSLLLLTKMTQAADLSQFLKKRECTHYHEHQRAARMLPRDYINPRNHELNYSLESHHIPVVFEDYCPSHRWQASNLPHISPEVTVNYDYKFVYVTQRKNGSSQMTTLLIRYFQSKPNFCKVDQPACTIAQPPRCTIECLPAEVLDNFYFFTISRHPHDRVYSSLSQMLKFNNASTDVSAKYFEDYLHNIARHGCVVDAHFETQSFAMFSPTRNGSLAPLHYVGQLETLNDDLRVIFEEIARRSGKELPKGLMDFLQSNNDVVANQSPAKTKEQLRQAKSTKIEHLLHAIYGQDMTCLGYATHNHSHSR